MSKGPFQLTVPMGGASFIWNGQNETFYLHGTAKQMTNDLPGMLNMTSSVTVDAMVNAQSGAFDFTLSSTVVTACAAAFRRSDRSSCVLAVSKMRDFIRILRLHANAPHCSQPQAKRRGRIYYIR